MSCQDKKRHVRPAASSEIGAHFTTTIAIPASALTVIAAPPAMLSQNTVESFTGIGSRVFLETIRAPGFPLPVSSLGKLRLVVCADFVAWLRGRASTAPSRAADANDGDSDRALLDELGLEVAPVARRAARR